MPSPAEKVFGIPELGERILLAMMDPELMFQLPAKLWQRPEGQTHSHNEVVAQYFAIQRTSRDFRRIINSSQVLKYYMLLPHNGDDPTSHAQWTKKFSHNKVRTPYRFWTKGHGTSRVFTLIHPPWASGSIQLSTGTRIFASVWDGNDTEGSKLSFTIRPCRCDKSRLNESSTRRVSKSTVFIEGASVQPSWMCMKIWDNGGKECEIMVRGRRSGTDRYSECAEVKLRLPQQNTMAHLCQAAKIILGEQEEDKEAGLIRVPIPDKSPKHTEWMRSGRAKYDSRLVDYTIK